MHAWILSILNATYPFTLPELEYATNSLEPHIDAATMEIHHKKHHQAYINNLNTELEKHSEYQQKPLFWLVENYETLPEKLSRIVRNHGGGHLNHSLFWQMLSPTHQTPSTRLEAMINNDFDSLENFVTEFNKAALSVFGSGWAWVCIDAEKKLSILATPNQDNPCTKKLFPILGLDVWEHAYYLKYQNQRTAYINAFWNIINWEKVESCIDLHNK
jgi:Fe-Mn family superoxide dismutase